MRSVAIGGWKDKMPDGSDVDVDLVYALEILLRNVKKEEMPRGLDAFRLFGKINAAFEDARKTKELKLREPEYLFLKRIVEGNVPADWGRDANVSKVLNDFLEAKEVGE